ncbi:MAG: hypothetical protein CBD58_04445 [bacterium TMED198]|nr:MAG: hypothetical protein CBD58_04445 [bacterium TMED198]|tara:strand:+ start:6082 stop:8217 length:2136 start_codon:yes stop_codon:yes gene_type:complete
MVNNKIIFMSFFANLFFISFCISATFNGTVLDQFGSPIDKANIIYDSYGSSTDKNGNFFIELDETKPNKIIKISHIGYKTKSISVNFFIKGQNEIVLDKDYLLLDQVVTTGIHLEKSLLNSPILTEVISNDQIRQMSASSLMDVLEKTIPSIESEVQQHGGQDLNIQGLDSKYYLFLIDGVRMAGETAGNIDFNRINLSNIDRIEIINGGASVLYGSGAVGGVVNIITKGVKENLDLSITTKSFFKSIKNDQYISSHINYGINSFFIQLDANLKKGDGYRNNNGLIIQPVFGYYSLGSRVKFVPSPRLSADFRISKYLNDSENFNDQDNSFYKFRDIGGLFVVNYSDLQSKKINFFIKRDNYKKNLYNYTTNEGNQVLLSDYNILHSRLVFILDENINFFKNVSFGIESFYESVNSPDNLNVPDDGYFGSSISLREGLTQSIFLISDLIYNNYQFVIGARLDNHSNYGNHFGPKMSFMYKKNNNYTYRLNMSKNFRSPTLKELYMNWSHGGGGGFILKGDSLLLPEESFNLSATLEFHKSNYYATLKCYSNYIKNMILDIDDFMMSDDFSAGDTLIYSNIKSVSVSGLDLTWKYYKSKKLQFVHYMSYLYPYNNLTGSQLDGTNRVSMKFSIDYSLLEWLQISSSTKYIGEKYYSEKSTDPYFVVNFSSKTSLNSFISFSFGVDNVLNYQNENNFSTVFGQTFFINMDYKY